MDIALFGIGGYGRIYVAAVLEYMRRPVGEPLNLVGVADPAPEACPQFAELVGLGVKIFGSAEELLAATRPELVVISSPIQYHLEHVKLAVSAGCHVLCEKPLCASMEQAEAMECVVNGSDRHVAVGYQWSFSECIQRLKWDILQGAFGRAVALRTLVCWPRGEIYYGRNRWVGRARDEAGREVFDSPVNNAFAHFLHNMLYLLGDSMGESAWPETVTAELYRCNPIEMCDTAVVRSVLEGGVSTQLVVSHATQRARGPVLEYQFEKASLLYDESRPETAVFRAIFHDGEVRDYGAPPSPFDAAKLFLTVRAIRQGQRSICGVSAAMPHAAVASGCLRSCEVVGVFAEEFIVTEGPVGNTRRWVKGLDAMLDECFVSGQTPAELKAEWGTAGREVWVGRGAGVLAEVSAAVVSRMSAERAGELGRQAGGQVGAAVVSG